MPNDMLMAIERAKSQNSLLDRANAGRDSFMAYRPYGKDTLSMGDIVQPALEMAPLTGDAAALESLFDNLQGGNYGSAVLDAISLPPGGDLIAKGASTALPALGMIGQTMWHGSPHKFSRFGLEKIGTGEGAQAYGHGLYFSEHPDVAKSYAPRDPELEDFMVERYNQLSQQGDYPAMEVYERAMLHETPDELRAFYNDPDNGYEGDYLKRINEAIDEFTPKYAESGTHLYKVDIPDEAIDNMLDWDSTVGDMPAGMKKRLEPILADIDPLYANEPDLSGRMIYNLLEEKLGSQQAASDYLKANGIPGIRYFDQASRSQGATDATRNMVLFDDSLVKIVDRNGNPVTPTPEGFTPTRRNNKLGDQERAIDFLQKNGVEVDLASMTGPEKSALSRYGKSLKNKAVWNRESMRYGLPEQITEVPIETPRTEMDLESLFDKVLIPTQGDSSRAGVVYENIGGVPLDRPVLGQGGIDYPRVHAGNDLGWASNYGVAKGKQSHVDKAAELTGRDPVMTHIAMSPEASDFSRPPAEIYLNELQALALPKSDIRAFNKALRQTMPDFVGLDSQYAYNQLMGLGEFGQHGAGARRVNFLQEAKKAKWRDKGFPVYEDILNAVNEPRLAGYKSGDSGAVFYEGRPGVELLPDSQHQSYSHGIAGQYLGNLDTPVPAEIMFPDLYRHYSKKVNRAGQPLTHEQIVGAIKGGHGYQVVDEQMLEGLFDYLQSVQGQ